MSVEALVDIKVKKTLLKLQHIAEILLRNAKFEEKFL